MKHLSIIEYTSFNLKSRLTFLADEGCLIAIVRVADKECSLHQIFNFYMLLIYDVVQERAVDLKPISIKHWSKCYELFYINN